MSINMHPVHVYFSCKQCGNFFQKVDQFIEHKQQNHSNEFNKMKCIVFEDRTSEYKLEDGFPNLNFHIRLKQESELTSIDTLLIDTDTYAIKSEPIIIDSPPSPTPSTNATANNCQVQQEDASPSPASSSSSTKLNDRAQDDDDPTFFDDCTYIDADVDFDLELEPDLKSEKNPVVVSTLINPSKPSLAPEYPYVLVRRLTAKEIQAAKASSKFRLNPKPKLKSRKIRIGIQTETRTRSRKNNNTTTTTTIPSPIQLISLESGESDSDHHQPSSPASDSQGCSDPEDFDYDSANNLEYKPKTRSGTGRRGRQTQSKTVIITSKSKPEKKLKKLQVKKILKKDITKKDSRYTSLGQFIFPTVDSDTETHSQSPTTLGDWLTNQMLKINQTKHDLAEPSSTSANIILLDPDPIMSNIFADAINFENPIRCKLCSADLVSEQQLKIHVKHCYIFNKRRHLYCTICDRALYSPKYLRRHILRIHGSAALETSGYSQFLKTGEELKEMRGAPPTKAQLRKRRYEQRRKIQLTSGKFDFPRPGLFTCILCNKTFRWQSKYDFHLRCHKGQRQHVKNNIQPTSNTNEENPTSSNEKDEQDRDLDRDQELGATLDECRINSEDDLLPLRDWLLLQQQEQEHEEPGVSKSNKKNIIVLDPDPTDETIGPLNISQDSPIECKLCCAKLYSEAHVKTHVKSCWLYNKSFHRYCVLCRKSFVDRFALKNHALFLHATDEEKAKKKTFMCQFCPRVYFKRYHLANHEESHKSREEQNRPHVCEFCGKSFRFRRDMNTHLAIHSDERPFLCPFLNCTHACKQQRGLTMHIKSMHGIE